MIILQVNKFFQPKGGAESYLFGLIKLLKQKNHQILVFSQKSQDNFPSNQEKYFISPLDLSRFNWKMVFKIGRIFWSFEARKKISRLLEAENPEIVHLHNIYHQISPSILPAIKKRGPATVMTVHDFKLIKPDYTLWTGQPQKTKPWPARLILAAEFAFQRFLKIYRKNIDRFLAPSEFVKQKLVEAGFPAEKIKVVPLFIDLTNYPEKIASAEDYLLSFGRLDFGKGLDTLLKAISLTKNPEIKLKIAGDGQERKSLEKLAGKLKISDQVEFLGLKTKKELISLITKSKFCLFPSRVQETFGLGILESFGGGKPVIASKTGAFPELVKNNQTGKLVAADNPEELAEAISEFLASPEKITKLGKNAKKTAQKYSPQKHYQDILKTYQEILKK